MNFLLIKPEVRPFERDYNDRLHCHVQSSFKLLVRELSSSVLQKWKAIEQYFQVVLFIMLYKVRSPKF